MKGVNNEFDPVLADCFRNRGQAVFQVVHDKEYDGVRFKTFHDTVYGEADLQKRERPHGLLRDYEACFVKSSGRGDLIFIILVVIGLKSGAD